MAKLPEEILLNLDQKMDKVQDKLHSMEKIQIRHEENLKLHMKRSEATEDRLEYIEEEVVPILKDVKWLKTTAAVITTLLTIITLIFKFNS